MGTTTLAAGLGTSQIGALRPINSPENLEIIQDAIAAMFAGGTQTNVTIFYDDTTGTLSFTASGGGGGDGGGAGGDLFGPAASSDGELMLYSGTTGKNAGRASALSGFIQLTAGVVSALTAGQFKTALSLVKGDVGLGNVDNTSDANKPVSTLQAAALVGKLDKTGGTLTGPLTLVGAGVNPLEAVTLQQLNDYVQGLRNKGSARLRTAAALPTCTYNNGASGVGATLTANANGALTIDSLGVAVDDIVVIGDQAIASQNGLYVVTQPGGAGVPWVLTRATSLDIAAEFLGAFVFITAGTYAGRMAYATYSGSFVVGTTALTWATPASSLGSTDALPEGSANLYFTETRARSTLLSGLNTTVNAAITAADSILSAMGKLQKQITDALAAIALKANAASPTFSGVVTSPGSVTVVPVAVSGNVIDFSVGENDYTLTGTTATPTTSNTATGRSTIVKFIGFTSDCAVTLPTGGGVTWYSTTKNANITSFVVPANSVCYVTFVVTASTTRDVIAEPQPLADRSWNRTQTTGANETKTLVYKAAQAGTIKSIKAKTAAGSISVKVQKNGSDVTGASVSAVTGGASSNATAANTFAVDDTITLVYSSNSGASGTDVSVIWTPAGL